jgi:CMP-N,N'-diacetyllegionaminic acid synthase
MDDLPEHTVVAIIPARGGSKEIPKKNLRELAGKPLLWYAVNCAHNATRVQITIVSTEDPEIADYAISIGTQVFRHPPELSGDGAPTFPVIKWDLGRLRESRVRPSLCVVLRATTPLRTSEDVDQCLEMLDRNPCADSVVSVAPAIGIHPVRLKRILEDGRLVDGFEAEGNFPKRRQELELLYLRNGGIYAAKPGVIDRGGLWGLHCLAYVMPQERSININTEFDFKIAEMLITCK